MDYVFHLQWNPSDVLMHVIICVFLIFTPEYRG